MGNHRDVTTKNLRNQLFRPTIKILSLQDQKVVRPSFGRMTLSNKDGRWAVEVDRSDRDEHGGTRTPDPQNRNLMLYPTELHAQTLGSLKEPIAGA